MNSYVKGSDLPIKPSERLANTLLDAGLVFEREYRFHPTRLWRFDFAFPNQRVAVEFEGGIYRHNRTKKNQAPGEVSPFGRKSKPQKSRHLTIEGFEEDCRKYNAAGALGWRVIRVTTGMVRRGEVLADIQQALSMKVGE